MDAATSQMILDFIPQGGFAAFLLWQYLQQKNDLAALRKESKDEAEQLRDRYSKVINDLTTEKEQMRDDLKQQVNTLSSRLNELEKTLVALVTKLEQITDQIKELRTR